MRTLLQNRKNKSLDSVQCTTDCSSMFNHLGHARKHFLSVHLKLNCWKCRKCQTMYARRENLLIHISAFHFGKIAITFHNYYFTMINDYLLIIAEIKHDCADCKMKLSFSRLYNHTRLGHYTPTGQQVLYSPSQKVIQFRLFKSIDITGRE